MKRPEGQRWFIAITLLVASLVATTALVFTACGGSGTTASTPPSTAGSPSTAVAISPTPTPTPTRTWTPGASPIPAATFPAQEVTTTGLSQASFGWSFEPTVDVQVTHLGYYDDAGNGLRHAHPVGIYAMDSEKLLARVTVKPHSPLEASYRFAKIEPVTLKAGRNYIVVTYAMPPFDPEVNLPSGLVWAPEIEQAEFYVEEPAKRLVFPTVHEGLLWMTPSFKYRPVSVASPMP